MESICTLSTIKNIKDLQLLLKSLELIGNNRHIYILCDKETSDVINVKNNIHLVPTLEVPSQSRREMVKNNIWIDFMLKKCDIIDEALRYHKNTLFVDSDIVFLNDFSLGLESNCIGLSPHYITLEDEYKYGRYNGGYLATANSSFTSWWRDATRTSKFMEQECLMRASSFFHCNEIDIQHNFGWWRLFQAENTQSRKDSFLASDNIYFEGLPLISIHTHFFSSENYSLYRKYNSFILKLLKQSTKLEHQELFKIISSGQSCFNFLGGCLK